MMGLIMKHKKTTISLISLLGIITTLFFTFIPASASHGVELSSNGETITVADNKVLDRRLVSYLPDNTDPTKVTSIHLGENVTAPENAGALFSAYYDDSEFKNLKEIVGLSNLDTKDTVSMNDMFRGDSKLESLDLSGFNTSKVQTMMNMFDGMSKIQNLDLSSDNFNSDNLTATSFMFNGDSDLQSINFSPSFNVSKVISMIYMFCGDTSLKKLDLSNFNTDNVLLMGQLFNGDKSLESIKLSNKFKTNRVTNMYAMFKDNSSLKSLDLSSFDMSNLEKDSNEMSLVDFLSNTNNLRELVLGNNTRLTLSGMNAALPNHGNGDEFSEGWHRIKDLDNASKDTPLYNTSADLMNKYDGKEAGTYVWNNKPTPTTPTIPENPVTPGKPGKPNDPGKNTPIKGMAIYATDSIYLYKHSTFNKHERKAFYVKKPRINRPMFVVTGYSYSKSGKLRYQVRDVNHLTKNKKLRGYITANSKYVLPVYYRSQTHYITVINPDGINSYRRANLTKKATHYKQGSILKVVKLIKHNLTTRYVLNNGQYITANRKLVMLGKKNLVKKIKAKHVTNIYSTVNLSHKVRHVKSGQILTVKGFLYSDANSTSKHGSERYHVVGGYVSTNAFKKIS